MPKNINSITIIITIKALYLSKNLKYHSKVAFKIIYKNVSKMYFSPLICLFQPAKYVTMLAKVIIIVNNDLKDIDSWTKTF